MYNKILTQVVNVKSAYLHRYLVIADAANDNGGDYEFFKVSIADGKRIEWAVDPEVSDTEMHFRVYRADQEYLGNEDGSDGQTITGSMNNTSGTDTYPWQGYRNEGCLE